MVKGWNLGFGSKREDLILLAGQTVKERYCLIHYNSKQRAWVKIRSALFSHLTNRYKNALVILLQETHCTNADWLVIPNYTLAGWISSRKHGLAMFVHERLKWIFADQSFEGSATEWLCVNVDGCKIVNIYKPPNSQLTAIVIAVFESPCRYSGDSNCWHTHWGYDFISPDGECLANWAA